LIDVSKQNQRFDNWSYRIAWEFNRKALLNDAKLAGQHPREEPCEIVNNWFLIKANPCVTRSLKMEVR
jgi:hypothetical protein